LDDNQTTTLTDEQHDWATGFTGLQTRPNAMSGDPASAAAPSLDSGAPQGGADSAAGQAGTDPGAGQTTADPPPGQTTADSNTGQGGADPAAGQADTGSTATGTDPPKMISVSLLTKYGQTVRYWVQDLATDPNTEVPVGSGKLIVTGEEFGPDQKIALSCIGTPNGAVICYQRESHPNPPGGGLTPWTREEITEGSTFEVPETPQPLDPPNATDPTAGQTATDPGAGQTTADPPPGQTTADSNTGQGGAEPGGGTDGGTAAAGGGSTTSDGQDDSGGGVILTSGGAAATGDTYSTAILASDWKAAAEALEKLNSQEIQDRLGKLTPDQLAAIHTAAEQDPALGPSSIVYLYSGPAPKTAAPPKDDNEKRDPSAPPLGLDGPSRADQDKKAGDSLSSAQPTQDDRDKATTKSYTDALQKVAEAALKEFLKTPQGKELQEYAEKELDKVSPAVVYGIAGSVIAGALAGLAATHQESPITETPKLKLFNIGKVGVGATVTWKGPVDKPTESKVMFTFDIPLGDDPAKKKVDTSKGAAGPGPSGDFRPPPKEGRPVLIANFDGRYGVDKIMKDLASHTSADGGGRIIVVGYFTPAAEPADKNAATPPPPEDAVKEKTETMRRAIEQMVDTSRYRVEGFTEFKVTGGRTFGVGAEASALGTRDMAVIFVPKG
jgi:hypothetical protein